MTATQAGAQSPFAQPARTLSGAALEALAQARAAETDDARYAAIALLVPDGQKGEFEELVKLAVHSEAAKERREKDTEKRRLRLLEEARKEYEQECTERLTSSEGMAEAAQQFASGVMDRDGILAMPEAIPLINDFLCREQLCRIFGPPKSLKSFIALDMAMSVSTGVRWAGYGTHRARVLYVVAEGARGTKRRMAAWEQHHGGMLSEVRWYPRAVQIGDPEQMRQLIAYCAVLGVGFVIFDTQARCTVGREENSNSEMGQIIAALDALKEATSACVLLVHHSGTEGGRGRGATAWDGAVDAEFEVRREEGSTRVVLRTRFQKDIEEAPEIALEGVRTGESLAFQPEGDTPPPPVEILVTDKQAMALRAVSEFGEIGVAVTGIAAALGLTSKERNSMGTRVSALLEKGFLRKVSGTARYEITYHGRRQLDAITSALRSETPAEPEPDPEQPGLDIDT
ncbi:AAA family ATPase [Streptomyces sp. NPDC018019]|uniref:AAA family ATPase n=1 Tax=Streptomyces sp. NPDC018019 TaxID=3365030 RepID=UPI00379E1187